MWAIASLIVVFVLSAPAAKAQGPAAEDAPGEGASASSAEGQYQIKPAIPPEIPAAGEGAAGTQAPIGLPTLPQGIERNAETPASALEQDEPSATSPEMVPPVTVDSARINMPAVVESYIARHSTRGVWTIKDKPGKTWHLRGPKTLTDSVRRSGEGLFSAHVLLRTARPPAHKLDFEFTVDFSGDDWKVTQYRLSKIDGKSRK